MNLKNKDFENIKQNLKNKTIKDAKSTFGPSSKKEHFIRRHQVDSSFFERTTFSIQNLFSRS